MKEILERIMFKSCATLASLALVITALNVNTTCAFFSYQEKLPNGADRLRKK